LETGDYKTLPDPALVTYPLFKAALLAINVGWPPVWACAYAYRLDYDKSPLFPGAELFPYSAFHIPVLGYLPASRATGLTLPPMSATEDRLDPSIPEHWRRAGMIAETMVARTGQSFSR